MHLQHHLVYFVNLAHIFQHLLCLVCLLLTDKCFLQLHFAFAPEFKADSANFVAVFHCELLSFQSILEEYFGQHVQKCILDELNQFQFSCDLGDSEHNSRARILLIAYQNLQESVCRCTLTAHQNFLIRSSFSLCLSIDSIYGFVLYYCQHS